MKAIVGAAAFVLATVTGFVVAATVGAEVTPWAEDTGGVYASVTSGTLTDAIDTEVFAIEQIGNRIYVGGKFTQVRATSGSNPISQSFLAAFDAGTGTWISSFQPILDRPVYALQASPDGSRLFVGGEFGDVAGVADTQALVALNPTTGAVDTSWKSQIKRNGRAVVYELAADSNWLYVGGSFDAVGGAEGVGRITVSNATKLSVADGRPDTNWRPTVSGGSVWGIAVSPDRATVYLAGYFSSVNGRSGTQGFVAIDNSTGSTVRSAGRLPHNNSSRPFYYDVVATNDLVFVAGMEHIVWVLNAGDLSVRTRHSTGGTSGSTFGLGGDYQDLEVVGGRVYASCHCRGEHFADGDIYAWLNGRGGFWSRRDPIKFVAAYSASTGAYLPSFQLDVSGSSGVWGIHGAPNGCLWVGGDLTRAARANGTNQPRGGFTKHCEPGAGGGDSTRPSTPTGLRSSVSGADVGLSWTPSTDNVGVVSYDIFRSPTNGGAGERIGSSTTPSYTDTGRPAGTWWYYVRAQDAAGNLSWRSGFASAVVIGTTDTQRPSTPTGLRRTALTTDSVDLSWSASTDNVGVVQYVVTNNATGAVVATSTSTTVRVSGLSSRTTYSLHVRAEDAAGNLSYRSNLSTFTTP